MYYMHMLVRSVSPPLDELNAVDRLQIVSRYKDATDTVLVGAVYVDSMHSRWCDEFECGFSMQFLIYH